MEEKEKNLIELKHKVLSERIDRLYNIFIVLSQDGEHQKNLRLIEVIKEQYEKMYNAILERKEFEKYVEVENTIIPKISKIEAELDRHIYKTSQKCEQILKDCIFSVYKYDNVNIDEKLDKIKAIKEILKLYMPYIKSELKFEIEKLISEVKYDILKRKEINGMTTCENAGMGSLLSHCDSEEEKESFKSSTRVFFSKYTENYMAIMENEDELSKILRGEIIRDLAEINGRVNSLYRIFKILHIVEKTNGRMDITKDVETIGWIQKKYNQLHKKVYYDGQYSKYLEIKSMIPDINELIRKLNEYVKNSPNGMDYILDTVISDEYMRQALLTENEESFDKTLKELMKKYKHDVIPWENPKFNKAKERWLHREDIRKHIKRNWRMPQICDEEKTALRPLLDYPIFDTKVLLFNYKERVDEENNEFKYFRSLIDKKYSVNDWLALRTIDSLLYSPKNRYTINDWLMDYHQKLIWHLYTNITDRTVETKKYYMIELDRECEFCLYYCANMGWWPVLDGTELYNLPDFSNDYDKQRLVYLYARTKKLIVKTHELKMPLDESKMRIISDEEAEEFISRVKKGEYNTNINKIVDDIFALWLETNENGERRNELKEKIKENIKKWSMIGYHPFEKVKCRELYIAIKKEVYRIKSTSKDQKISGYDSKKVRHLISFMDTFLEEERGLFDRMIYNAKFELSER